MVQSRLVAGAAFLRFCSGTCSVTPSPSGLRPKMARQSPTSGGATSFQTCHGTLRRAAIAEAVEMTGTLT
jgi:hypothetical protein